MDDESLGEEETAFLDVKQAKTGERRQFHFLQLHSVSSSACNPQTLNRWQAVLVHTNMRNRRHCSQGASTLVSIIATQAILLGKKSTWHIHNGVKSRFRWTITIQIHCVTKSGSSPYGLVGERKGCLVVAPGRSVPEHCCQSIRVLRYQLSQIEKETITADWSEIGNVYSSPMYSRLTSQLNTIETNKTIIPDRHCFKKREIWLSFSRHSLLFITREESYLYG